MKGKLLSVITVNYNNDIGLLKTLESFKKFNLDSELLVIDGGSSDESLSILNEAKRTIENIIIISEKDKGIYHAMNKGIKLSKGDWINFMNSGDTFFDISEVEEILKNNKKTDVIYGNQIYKGKRINPLHISVLEKGIIHASHQSMFFNIRKIKTELYYKSFYKIYGDYELVNRLYIKKFKFKFINKCIADTEPGGISQKISFRKRLEKFLIILRSYGILGIVRSYFK
jgi:glycosyltransferase involved in cell wall biosynthesis